MKVKETFRGVNASVATIILSAAALVPLLTPGVAHAATTFTWTGGGSDAKWSTAANWAGNAAPQSSDVGDIITIDNSANFSNGLGSVDDIAGLSVASVVFTNNASAGFPGFDLGTNLTVTGAITQASSDTNTPDSIGDDGTARTLTVGGSVTVTSTAGITIGDITNGDTLALNSNTLTFTDNGGNTGNITAIYSNITGSGTVVYNAPVTDFQLYGNNTYSGTTHVIVNNLPIGDSQHADGFGSSSINVENGGSISFASGTSTTINNAITIAGTANGSPVTSLDFNDNGAASVVITVPHITLSGSTRFSNAGTGNPQLVVNLAGITANGHCLEYLNGTTSATDGPANGFQNGPAGCVVDAATSDTAAPKTPNTGFALMAAHPVVTLAVTLLSTVVIFAISRASRKHAGSR